MILKPGRRLTPRKVILLAYDSAVSVLAILIASYLRFDGLVPQAYKAILWNYWFIYPLATIVVFYLLGCYDQMWAFAGIPQFLLLPASIMIEVIGLMLVLPVLKLRLPYSVYIIYFLILSALVVLFRVVYKWYESINRRNVLQRSKLPPEKTVRTLIVGAGNAGYQLVNEMKNSASNRLPVGFVDDNPYTWTFKNQGLPVLGSRKDIPNIVKDHKIDEIIVAIPSAHKQDIREIVQICNKTRADVRIVPTIPDILAGDVQLSDIREVDIEDLLGRDPVKLDLTSIAGYLKGKTVMITGGGGSIGSEIARQVVKFKPARLILFEIYENNVYGLQQELLSQYKQDFELLVLIGSVRDRQRLTEIFERYHPEVIFHAAAHKHVPLMQDSPCDAVKNNVFGTWNVADIAGQYGAERFVLISTDKAVNPTNVMGATKRFAEMTILAMTKVHPKTRFAAVRFGNVLGSSGSVIPLFKQQIKEQHLVTVTHPDIVRFFMTIPEASRLVLQAGGLAEGGEIFVLDMGEPVKIADLAKELIRLSGYEPDVDIPIKYIGLRPGEKLYEELSLDEEEFDQTSHEKISRVRQIHDRASLEKESQHLARIINCGMPEFASFRESLIAMITQEDAETETEK